MNRFRSRCIQHGLIGGIRPPLNALVAGVLCVFTSAAAAQDGPPSSVAAPIAERCRAPEHRGFDFWIGTWEVRDRAGELLGHNEIRRVAGGCGLLENWRGVGGGRGVSVNTYDTQRRRWTQRWVGSGATLWLEGRLENGAMVLAAVAPRDTPRGEVLDRIAWTPLPDGRVRQVWAVSGDGGKTWHSIFVGLYARPEGP
jgi:hypothetical protein